MRWRRWAREAGGIARWKEEKKEEKQEEKRQKIIAPLISPSGLNIIIIELNGGPLRK